MYNDLNNNVSRSKQHLSNVHNSFPSNPRILSNRMFFQNLLPYSFNNHCTREM